MITSSFILRLLIISSLSFTIQANSKCDLSSFKSDPALVDTKYGKLQGACYSVNFNDPDKSNRSENVLSWLGVPYAEPPVNEKRFMRPVTIQPWWSTRNATKLPSICIQKVTSKTGEMSDDCLYLNIYAPLSKKTQSKLLPVYIFLHGGTFVSGSGSDFDPSYAVGLSNTGCFILFRVL
jgi:hypothetical protein